MGDVEEVFQPKAARVLVVFIALICAIALVVLVVDEGVSALWEAGPPLALVAGACWACFWRPKVVVHDGGVRLVNVLRTIDLSWPSIQYVDTKWAVTLVTAYGRFTGWAAPAPGAREAVRTVKTDKHHLPDSAWTAAGSRPGDLPSTASGSAALLIRRRWDALQKQGFLDEPRLEKERPPVTWHIGTLAVGAALAAATVVSLLN